MTNRVSAIAQKLEKPLFRIGPGRPFAGWGRSLFALPLRSG
jgi:hypothetical protein